jgi:small-conductance mechanosensitive channel
LDNTLNVIGGLDLSQDQQQELLLQIERQEKMLAMQRKMLKMQIGSGEDLEEHKTPPKPQPQPQQRSHANSSQHRVYDNSRVLHNHNQQSTPAYVMEKSGNVATKGTNYS